MNKRNLFYICLFVFFLLIFFLSPISGDDWGNYLVGKTGLIHSIGNAVGMYFDWEGRFISRILINILTYHKLLWNVINSLIICFLIYIINKFINPKNKKIILILSIFIILLMNIYTFSQTITWIAGNITYLFVIPFILYYFYFIIFNKKYSKIIFFLICIFILLMTMFVEHMALILIIGNLLLLISNYIKNKTIDKRIFIYLILSIVGFLFMFLSPGNRFRNSIENTSFNELSFINKIFYNLPNFIYYTFIINSYMLILNCFSNYILVNRIIVNKYYKLFFLIYFLFIPLITIFFYPISNFININFSYFIDSNNKFIIVYWLSYLIISFIFNIINNIKSKNNLITFFFILGVFANGVMLLSPTWGFRTSLFTYICFSVSSLFIIDSVSLNKKIYNCLFFCLICCMLFYITLYINVFRCQNDVVGDINRQVKSNSENIIISSFPNFVNCNINPMNDYHLEKFKSYYGIANEKEIIFDTNNWKYGIFYVK